MLKNLLAVIFILSIAVQAKLAWGESYTFRYTRWGMSVEEVIAAESKLDPIEKSEHQIKYKTQVLGRNVELVYQFVQNKLIGSSYKLDDNYLNSKHFLDSYRNLGVGGDSDMIEIGNPFRHRDIINEIVSRLWRR